MIEYQTPKLELWESIRLLVHGYSRDEIGGFYQPPVTTVTNICQMKEEKKGVEALSGSYMTSKKSAILLYAWTTVKPNMYIQHCNRG